MMNDDSLTTSHNDFVLASIFGGTKVARCHGNCHGQHSAASADRHLCFSGRRSKSLRERLSPRKR